MALVTRFPSVPLGQTPWIPNTVGNLTATGSTQGTALAIPLGQDLSVVTTVASATGTVLPGPAGISLGEDYIVANHGANALEVYTSTGGKIGTLATNGGYSLAAGASIAFRYVGGNSWCVGA